MSSLYLEHTGVGVVGMEAGMWLLGGSIDNEVCSVEPCVVCSNLQSLFSCFVTRISNLHFSSSCSLVKCSDWLLFGSLQLSTILYLAGLTSPAGTASAEAWDTSG